MMRLRYNELYTSLSGINFILILLLKMDNTLNLRHLQGQDQFLLLSDPGPIHYFMMFLVWLIAANIGLWSQAFKQYKWTAYIHYFCMSIVTIITWMSGFLALLAYGVNAQIGSFHVGLGIAIMVIVVLQSLAGALCAILQKSSNIRPDIVHKINVIHRVSGFILLLLVMIQILVATISDEKQLFTGYIVVGLASLVGYILLKILRKKMEGYAPIQYQDSAALPLAKNSQDLAKLSGDYFIFADRVYDIKKVITNHPGGFEVINSIRGREVDRFLYGSEALQTVQKMHVHGHSASSIKMAGDPIAILHSVCPFQNMKQVAEVSVTYISQPCKSRSIYAPYLTSKSRAITYKGYSELSQLGKYYAVTIDNSMTRLYTMVNFMSNQNLSLMSRISGVSFEDKKQNLPTEMQLMSEYTSVDMKQVSSTNSNSFAIPLLIKKYEDGRFTSKFLSELYSKDVKISKPRGRGLSLHQMAPGELIFFAGGTGIHPFCDTIDLFFKEMFATNGNPYSNQIIEKDPIVGQNKLKSKFKLVLYCSFQDIGELHSLIAYQMHELCKAGIMKAHFRLSKNSGTFMKDYPSFTKIDKYFNQYVPQLANQLNNSSHVYMCGPPSMTKELLKSFKEWKVSHLKYRVL